jgi:hypothetical protein
MRYLSTENCLTTFSIVIHVLNCIITLSVSSEIIIKLTWNYYYLKKIMQLHDKAILPLVGILEVVVCEDNS